jgi:peptidoglycan hydrolase-like protein with peptidoglycan-binding domain
MLMLGARGVAVAEVQTLLNGKPSSLPRLNSDGIYGAKTRARVIEYQRDNALHGDGIVGHLTLTKLREDDDPVFRENELRRIKYIISNQLGDPNLRQAFMTRVQETIPPGKTNLLGAAQAVPVVVIVILFFLLMMVVILQNSRREADRQLAREWDRRFQRLKESIRGKPVEVQTAETLEEAKQRGKDVKKRVTEDRDKCLANLDPAKLAKCARVLKILADAIQSLLQKLITRTGGGITPENLAKGIAFSIQAVFDAARAAAECTGCDI